MAILGKRSRTYRRTTRRVRRRTARRMPVPRFRRLNAVSFTRTVNTGFWQPATTTTADFWKYYTFSTSDIPSWSEVSNMFDMYKINAIRVTFRPRFNSFDGANTTDTTLPGITNQAGTNLHIAVDRTPTLSPSGTYTRSNLNSFLETQGVRTYNGNRAVSVYFKPMILNALAQGNSWSKSQWMQSNATTPHYGFFAFAQDFNMNGTFGQSWDIFVKFYITAKGLR